MAEQPQPGAEILGLPPQGMPQGPPKAAAETDRRRQQLPDRAERRQRLKGHQPRRQLGKPGVLMEQRALQLPHRRRLQRHARRKQSAGLVADGRIVQHIDA